MDETPPINRRVLVIDDQPAVLADFRKILAEEAGSAADEVRALGAELFGGDPDGERRAVSFEVDTASQGMEGVAKAQAALARGAPYALAFVDVRMPPGIDGIETIQRLWIADPTLQVVICSAYSDHSFRDIQTQLGDSDGLLILRKPFDAIEVTQMAHALTRKWSLHQAERARLRAAQERVTKLQSLLPLCMHCGKIRERDDAWTNLDQYLTRRAEASFTHTVCPTCLAQHYPEG